jgi:HEAT repeat protein
MRGYQVIIQMARTGSDRLRPRAIYELGGLGQVHPSALPRIMPELLAIVLDRGRQDVDRCAAVRAFGYAGPGAKGAVPALLRLLKDPAASDVRWAATIRRSALDAMRLIGPGAKDAVPALIKLVEDEKQERQDRGLAMAALGAIGPAAKAAVPALTRLKERKGASPADRLLIRNAELALASIQAKDQRR